MSSSMPWLPGVHTQEAVDQINLDASRPASRPNKAFPLSSFSRKGYDKKANRKKHPIIKKPE